MMEQAHRKEPQVPGTVEAAVIPEDPGQAQEAERADKRARASNELPKRILKRN